MGRWTGTNEGLTPGPLDRLVEQETFAEIIARLEPEELVVAALRLEGLSDAQIGRMLGLTRAAVGYRMNQARRRIMVCCPDLAPALRGRRQPSQAPPRNQTPPLERGWLSRRPGALACGGSRSSAHSGADLTTRDVADCFGVTPQTVTRWIRRGRFPHAYRVPGPRGDYRIPESDLDGMEGPW